MSEEEVIFIFKKERIGFRFAIIETCPSKDIPFAVGISNIIPILSDKRIANSELEEEFASSLDDALQIVNEKFDLNYSIKDVKQVESLNCGRRLLYKCQSTLFSVDYKSTTI